METISLQQVGDQITSGIVDCISPTMAVCATIFLFGGLILSLLLIYRQMTKIIDESLPGPR